jgi:hypothetical protein
VALRMALVVETARGAVFLYHCYNARRKVSELVVLCVQVPRVDRLRGVRK